MSYNGRQKGETPEAVVEEGKLGEAVVGHLANDGAGLNDEDEDDGENPLDDLERMGQMGPKTGEQARSNNTQVDVIDISSDSESEPGGVGFMIPPAPPRTPQLTVPALSQTADTTLGQPVTQPTIPQPANALPDGGTFELAYRNVDHARLGITRIKVAPAHDDVAAVRDPQRQKDWVRELRAACLSQKKGINTPKRMTKEAFHTWLAEEEERIAKVNRKNPTQIEMYCWILLDEVCSVHELGILETDRALKADDNLDDKPDPKITATRNMQCSDRLRLIVEIISEYAIVALDLALGQKLDAIVMDPLRCAESKIYYKGSNNNKADTKLSDAERATNKEWWIPEEATRKQRDMDAKEKARRDFDAISNPHFTYFTSPPASGAPLGFYAAQAGALKSFNASEKERPRVASTTGPSISAGTTTTKQVISGLRGNLYGHNISNGQSDLYPQQVSRPAPTSDHYNNEPKLSQESRTGQRALFSSSRYHPAPRGHPSPHGQPASYVQPASYLPPASYGHHAPRGHPVLYGQPAKYGQQNPYSYGNPAPYGYQGVGHPGYGAPIPPSYPTSHVGSMTQGSLGSLSNVYSNTGSLPQVARIAGEARGLSSSFQPAMSGDSLPAPTLAPHSGRLPNDGIGDLTLSANRPPNGLPALAADLRTSSGEYGNTGDLNAGTSGQDWTSMQTVTQRAQGGINPRAVITPPPRTSTLTGGTDMLSPTNTRQRGPITPDVRNATNMRQSAYAASSTQEARIVGEADTQTGPGEVDSHGRKRKKRSEQDGSD